MRVGLRSVLATAGFVAFLSSCGGGSDGGGGVTPPPPDPPRVTQVTIAPTTAALGFLGETTNFTATVRNQNGGVMNVTVTWTSSNEAAVTVTSTGVATATAIANGTATITATASGISATANVTMLQVATQLLIVSGDGQSGSVGEALTDALVVQASDGGGTGMEGIDVTFSATGAGAVSTEATTSDTGGQASTTWTLGTDVAEGQQVTAVMGADDAQAVFNATLSAGAPAGFLKVSGDAQLAARGTAIAAPMVVSVTDAFDNPIPDVAVTFTVTGGGGSVETPNAMTDANGQAQTNWTLGSAPGANTASATTAGFTVLQFTATGVGVPDLRIASFGLSPTTPTHEQVVTFTATIQNDGDGPNVIDVPVAFAVDNVLVGTVQTGTVSPNGGQVTVSLQGGPFNAGGHAISVEVDPNGELAEGDETNNFDQTIFQVIEATVVTSGAPVTGIDGALNSSTYFVIEVAGASPAAAQVSGTASHEGPVAASVRRGGAVQKYLPDTPFERPGSMSPDMAAQFLTALQISLSGGGDGEDADLYVKFGEQPTTTVFDFRSTGSTNAESLTINSPQAGTWHILIFGFTAYSSLTLTADVGDVQQGEGEYDIELIFLTSATTSQMDAFEAARLGWESAILGDVPDVNFGLSPVAADACVDGQPAIVDIVDDVRIYVSLIPIDGTFGTLAQAGPCMALNTSNLPVLGFMEFDTADLDFLEGENALTAVVKHEMGHVLGIGTLWGPTSFNLIVNPSLPSSPGVDTHFTGQNAINAFDAAGGTAYVGGEKVPVENELGEGSGDSHWRESVFDNELMSPALNEGSNPLSAISIASLADLGYTVDTSAGDAFTFNFGLGAVARSGDRLIYFGNDVVRRPILVVDQNGRVVGMIRHD